MQYKRLPVIFLAFANDKQDRLNNLTKEKNLIQRALKPIHRTVCEVVVEMDVTADKIIEVFQDNKNNVILFHYAGHANDYDFLLNDFSGNTKRTSGNDLASFLSEQVGLELIFLNGCSTKSHKDALKNKGAKIVIGTNGAIEDSQACMVAEGFYEGLGKGITVKKAWDAAIKKVEFNLRPNTQGSFRRDEIVSRSLFTGLRISKKMRAMGRRRHKNHIDEEYLSPWQNQFEDTESIARANKWNLLSAAKSPLTGLALPNSYYFAFDGCPFPGFQAFTEKEAGVFFGRDHEIRALYNTLNEICPIILLHGENFVGKTSLIQAGLKPRIADDCVVNYKSIQKGDQLDDVLEDMLLDTIKGRIAKITQKSTLEKEQKKALMAICEDIIEDFETIVENSKLAQEDIQFKAEVDILLPDLWMKAEQLCLLTKQDERNQYSPPPMIIVLDQLELLIAPTEPDENVQALPETFFQTIRDLFPENDFTSESKIILICQNRYLKPFNEGLSTCEMPFTRFLLEPLSREGLIAVIKGIKDNFYIKDGIQYELEARFSDFIVDLLTLDYKSEEIYSESEAAFLQLMLRKIWQVMQKQETTHFTKNLYAAIGDQLWGLEYLDTCINSMMQIERQKKDEFSFSRNNNSESQKWVKIFEEAGKTGLIHDFLYQLTQLPTGQTEMEWVEMEKKYTDNIEFIHSLKFFLIRERLLMENHAGTHIRLINKALNPAITYSFDTSERPVQKATRIFVEAHELSRNELRTIIEAQSNMQVLNSKEQDLIQKASQRYLPDIVIEQIKNNRLKEALDNLYFFLEEYEGEYTSLLYDTILLSSNYFMLQENIDLGMINQNDENTERIRISDALTQICYEIKNERRLSIDYKKVETEILEGIIQNNIQIVLELFEQFPIDEDPKWRELLDNITHRYTNFVKKVDFGLIDLETETILISQIRYSLIGLLAYLKLSPEKHLNPYVNQAIISANLDKLEKAVLNFISEDKLVMAIEIIRKYAIEVGVDELFDPVEELQDWINNYVSESRRLSDKSADSFLPKINYVCLSILEIFESKDTYSSSVRSSLERVSFDVNLLLSRGKHQLAMETMLQVVEGDHAKDLERKIWILLDMYDEVMKLKFNGIIRNYPEETPLIREGIKIRQALLQLLDVCRIIPLEINDKLLVSFEKEVDESNEVFRHFGETGSLGVLLDFLEELVVLADELDTTLKYMFILFMSRIHYLRKKTVIFYHNRDKIQIELNRIIGWENCIS